MALLIGADGQSRVPGWRLAADSYHIAGRSPREAGAGSPPRGGRGSEGEGQRGSARTPDAARTEEFTPEQTFLLEVIASVADGLVVYAENGEEQWAKFRRTSAADARDVALRASMWELAGSLASGSSAPVGEAARAPGRGVLRDVAVAGGCYRLRAIRLWAGFFGANASVLVVAERLRERTLSRQRLSERFGLTAREIDVALLLAERRSNAEIARRLGISPHTARRHTEQVLLKIGAGRRHDVEQIVRRVTAADECAAEET
jgi:DNA-binding CsgD family transcriptional regulator